MCGGCGVPIGWFKSGAVRRLTEQRRRAASALSRDPFADRDGYDPPYLRVEYLQIRNTDIHMRP
jgi:hypothetical protein